LGCVVLIERSSLAGDERGGPAAGIVQLSFAERVCIDDADAHLTASSQDVLIMALCSRGRDRTRDA